MRIVLDTNVFLASLISPTGPTHKLFQAFLGDRFLLVTSEQQLAEFARVTRYPVIRTRIPPVHAGNLVNTIRLLAIVLGKLPVVDVSTDPKDNFLFAMAKMGIADYLVTGDKTDVLAVAKYGKTRIIGVRQMMRVLRLK
jgi:uncharacterized protein